MFSRNSGPFFSAAKPSTKTELKAQRHHLWDRTSAAPWRLSCRVDLVLPSPPTLPGDNPSPKPSPLCSLLDPAPSLLPASTARTCSRFGDNTSPCKTSRCCILRRGMPPSSSLGRLIPRVLARSLTPLHSSPQALYSLNRPLSPHSQQMPANTPEAPASSPHCPTASPSSPNQNPQTLVCHSTAGSQSSTSATAPGSPPVPPPGTRGYHPSPFPGAAVYNVGSSTNIKWHETHVSKETRFKLLRQKGCVIWFTGLSGSGKSTLAYTLEHALVEAGHLAYVLDGDNIRHGLNKNLGFSAADREENIRRVGEVAKLFSDTGVITIVSFISPYRRDRLAARALVPEGEFLEVYMKIPLSVCEDRDPKGLYKLARAGKIKGFTGIDDPYEEPENAEVVIEVSKEDGVLQPPEKMAQEMLDILKSRGILAAP